MGVAAGAAGSGAGERSAVAGSAAAVDGDVELAPGLEVHGPEASAVAGTGGTPGGCGRDLGGEVDDAGQADEENGDFHIS